MFTKIGFDNLRVHGKGWKVGYAARARRAPIPLGRLYRSVVSKNHVALHFDCQSLISSSIHLGFCLLISSVALLLRNAISGVS